MVIKRAVAALAGVAAVGALTVGATLKSGVLNTGPALTVPTQGPVYVGPTAKLAWSMPDRYALGWKAWRRIGATYARSYVYPRRWSLVVDGCGSLGHGHKLTRFDVRVTGVGFEFATTSSGSSCERRLDNLPRLGQYDVALTVHTDTGDSDRTVERVALHDWLIVSLGDSIASGEGSPDDTGRYEHGRKWIRPAARAACVGGVYSACLAVRKDLQLLLQGYNKVREIRPVRWQDKRCHRSARAGHAQVAAEIERRDPYSSVTFISLACSGADVRHLIDTPYSGQQPPADPRPEKLKPQLAALRELLRSYRPRRIDALLLAIGINDLGFSDIVKACATNLTGGDSCVYGDPDTGVESKLNDLGDKYDWLATALKSLNVAETYLTDYPAAPFGKDSGGCGLLGFPYLGISGDEAAAMYDAGQRLNSTIHAAANRNGWNYMEGMTQASLGRDYCKPSDHRYFIRLEESFAHQGTVHGTSHPNPSGHEALGSLLSRAVWVARPAYPFIRAKVTIDEVKMGESFFDPLDDFTVSFHASPQKTIEFRRGVGYMGRWMPIGLEFTADIYEPPRPPRFATKLSFDMRPVNACCKVITVNHGTRDSWGVGSHEVSTEHTEEHPDGYLQVRYHVVGERILDPAGHMQPVFTR
jgi:GDSL-like Lipase/Acylhydrolase family